MRRHLDMEDDIHKVFVYGTLKRGQPNHFLIEGEEHGIAKFLGEGRTVSQWPLVIATKYNVPFLLDAKGTGQRIHGELYEVNSENLKAFDKLEFHPTWYERNTIDIEILNSAPSSKDDDNSHVIEKCYGYIMTNFKEELLKLPFLECYENYQGTDKEYSKEYEQNPNFKSWVKKQ